MAELQDLDISDISRVVVSARTVYVLQKMGIERVSDMAKAYDKTEFLKWLNCGPATIIEIEFLIGVYQNNGIKHLCDNKDKSDG